MTNRKFKTSGRFTLLNLLMTIAMISLISAIMLPLVAKAQTNAFPVAGSGSLSTNATPESFLGTVEDYFTTFNPSLTNTFSTNQPFEAWAGASYQSSVNLGADIGLEAKPFAKYPGLMFRSVSLLGAVGGTIADQEVDVGYSIRHVDVEVSAFIGGDYDAVNHAEHLDVGAEIKKALTANTFAGAFVEGKFLGVQNSQPTVGVFTGFTF